MDEALSLADFLPVSYKARAESDYVAFLWDAFQSNYIGGKYEFSSLAFHLLYMSFVSFSIWQIRMAREQDFKYALIGFQSESELRLLDADSPFKFYDRLKESQIFRFLKLIGCGNDQVGEFAKFVKRRNKIAHPSGTVFFNDRESIDFEISEMLCEVAKIQEHMRPILMGVYGRFLIDSADEETREYAISEQEVEVNLIHRSYMSKRDLDVCIAYDLSVHAGHEDFAGIEALHAAVKDVHAGL
jgi:hypothetical protein